jgi:hypothetical protein
LFAAHHHRKERSSLSKQTALSGSSGSCARRVDDKEDFEDVYEKVYHHAPVVSIVSHPRRTSMNLCSHFTEM